MLVDKDEYLLFHSPDDVIGVKRSTDLENWADVDMIRLGQDEWPWASSTDATSSSTIIPRACPRRSWLSSTMAPRLKKPFVSLKLSTLLNTPDRKRMNMATETKLKTGVLGIVGVAIMEAVIMSPALGLCLFFLGPACWVSNVAADDAVSWVDPFICTDGDNGHTFPGAVTPFGLVKLSPDTDKSYHTATSGYDYSETRIHGFSHIRFGEGCLGSGGNILIKPGIVGFTNDKNKYRETYIKSSEKAVPGYYRVDFESGIRAELTVSPRVGFHKYTFPASGEASILVDLSRSYAGMLKASLKIENGNEVSGYVKSKNICGKQYFKLFYSIKFDKKFDNFKTWNKTWKGSNVSNEETACSGEDIGVWFGFSTSGNEIIRVKVGISPVSIEQAKYERDNEIPGWDFEQVRIKARRAWQDVLGKIEISGGSREMKTIFYTHLYHSCLDPVIASSSSGTYRAACDEYTIRKTSDTAPDYDYYCGWGLWDNFRKFSLLALTEPDIMQNVVRSLVDYYKNRYQGPFTGEYYWPAPTEAQGMEGLHFTAMVIADAYHKGLADFDIDAAFDGMMTDIEYMPCRDVGKALERASLAYAVMKMAKDLGRQKEYEKCRAIALSYKDLWNPGQMDNQGNVRGFFTPERRRVDDVETIGKYCYEGSLWQYRWFVPHDMKGFADLRGGREALADDLEYFFDHNFYMHINEQDIQAPFLFNYLGKPYLTQKWARSFTTKEVTQLYHNHGLYKQPIVKRIYRDDPEGYIRTMDDDYGALSSWFVFSAVGLFPGAPGDPHFLIGSPIFPEVRLRLRGNATFVVRANRVSEENFYIQSAKLNGNPYHKSWIGYADMIQGGLMELEMGPEPNLSWGSEQKDAPPSLSD